MPPNILLIISDQLAATALRAYGNPYGHTPNIDRIFESGVRFQTAFSNCPLCQPSRASFWTGRYPHQTGVRSNGRKDPVPEIPCSVPTVGSLFSEAGYRTVHFGKQHDAGGLRGFEKVEIGVAKVDDAEEAWPVNHDTEQDRDTRQKAVAFLEAYADHAPFLAVADFNNPHNICGYVGVFQGRTPLIHPELPLPELPANLVIDEDTFASLPLPVQYVCCAHNRQAQIAEWDETYVRHYLAAYHHYVHRVDEEIGHLLAALRSRTDSENTIVMFMSDHGDAMCSHWLATKHCTFYDETVRVPLAFTGPGIRGAGRKQEGLVSLIDLLPTLCELADIPVPMGLPGQSLAPGLRGEVQAFPDYVVSQWYTEWGFTVEPGRMLRTADFKYMHYLEGEGEELYDMRNDPLEMTNRAQDPALRHVIEDHRNMLRTYAAETSDPYFDLAWNADPRWRSHPPGYRNHRGPAAPQAE